ncbi:MAG: DUF5658 family protein [Parvularculaceae bacterium]
MVSLFFSKRRRQVLSTDASRSRSDVKALVIAIGVVIFYNLIGALDIVSTSLAIGLGLGEEANPIVRSMMERFGAGWILGKLAVQTTLSMMVLWFPHRYVLALFSIAVAANAVVVVNNFAIVVGG